jgi:hypothetical protein
VQSHGDDPGFPVEHRSKHPWWGLLVMAFSVESQLEKSTVSKSRYKKERMAFFAKDKYLCFE